MNTANPLHDASNVMQEHQWWPEPHADLEQDVMKEATDSDNIVRIFKALLTSNDIITGLSIISGSEISTYTLPQLEQGVTLITRSRLGITKDVIRMNVTQFNPASGGWIQLSILREYGFFNDDYRVYNLYVTRQENGRWAAFRSIENRWVQLDELYFVTRRVNGNQVGIEAVAARMLGQQIEFINTRSLLEI